MKWQPLDISAPIEPGMAVWPGDPPVEIERVLDLAAGDDVTVSRLSMSVHAGTHVDAPSHYLPRGGDITGLDLAILVGPAWVADVSGPAEIGPETLGDIAAPRPPERLLLKTRAAGRPPETAFAADFSAVSASGARWLVNQGVRLVGIDTPSIAPFDRPEETHRTLLSAGIVVVEGLVMDSIRPGPYVLVCLPLGLVGAEGAPARVVLLPNW